MKIAQISYGGRPSIAISRDGTAWHAVEPGHPWPWLRSLKSVIENNAVVDYQVIEREGTTVGLQDVTFDAPLKNIEKVICIGKNYAEHALEMGAEPPAWPVVFSKFPSALIGPNEEIVLPSISEQVDFEAELVVVIGRSGRNIEAASAMNHVFGYTIGNDVTARDWQKGRPGGQWLLGKTFDSFAPIGPFIVTADEIENPHALNIGLDLNGQAMQRGNTRDLIFRIDFLIAHVSRFFTLRPGDLLFTGTPAGVGIGRSPHVFLQPNDELKITIDGIGTLTSRVSPTVS